MLRNFAAELETYMSMKMFFMRSVLLTLLLMMVSNGVHAQYTTMNSYSRRAMVMYVKGSDGYYKRVTDRMLDKVDGLTASYAYDKKAQILYVLTENANCAVTLYKDYAKIIKKDESIKQLKGEELKAEIDSRTKYLDDKFRNLNEQRTRFVQDSIAKAKADSIEHIRELERQAAARKEADDSYRKAHRDRCRLVPVNNAPLYCTECEKSFTKDSLVCLGIKNDSIYFVTWENGDLDLTIPTYHAAKITDKLAKDKGFLYHYRIFKDSLTKDSLDYQDAVSYLNWDNNRKYLGNLQRIAPYGYFDGWGWDDEYSMLTFHFRYMNTNPKTIRYITVYFKVTNDVGDVRRTGYFKGTGPLEQWVSASWNWDSSHYYVSGDASNMSITKVVITWMNGKQQTVTGKYLQFNDQN